MRIESDESEGWEEREEQENAQPERVAGHQNRMRDESGERLWVEEHTADGRQQRAWGGQQVKRDKPSGAVAQNHNEGRVRSTRRGRRQHSQRVTGANDSHNQQIPWGLTDPVARPTASQQDPLFEQESSLAGDSREEYKKGSGEWDAG